MTCIRRYRLLGRTGLLGTLLPIIGMLTTLTIGTASRLSGQTESGLLSRSPAIHFGVAGSISRGIVRGNPPIYPGGPGCGTFATGVVSGGEAAFRLRFSAVPTDHLALSFRPSWRSELTRFREPLPDAWVYDREDGVARRLEREAELAVRSESFRLAVVTALQLDDRLALGIGPVLGYTTTTDVAQSDNIVSSGNQGFADGQRRRVMETAMEYRRSPLDVGLLLGAEYALPIGDRLHIGFDLDATVDLLSPVRGAGWTTFRLDGGIGLHYRLRPGPPDAPPVAMQDQLLPQPPTPMRITADIELYAVRDGRESEVIDVEFDEIDYCTVVLPTTSVQMPAVLPRRSPGTAMMEPGEVARLDDSVIHHRRIELAALQLRNGSTRTIGIRWAPEDGESGRVAAARLRQWLDEEYGIARDRILISEGRSERIQAGRLSLQTEGSRSIAPIRAHRLDRDFGAPTVRVRTSQEAEAGVRGWEITLTNDSNLVARYSSAQPEERGSTGIDWSLLYPEQEIDSSKLAAAYLVYDSLGGRALARTENQMVVRRVRIVVGRIVDLAEGRTTFLYALPKSTPPELRAWTRDLLGETVTENSRPGDVVRTTRQVADLLPERPDDWLEIGEIGELLEMLEGCAGRPEEIDPTGVIVVERTHRE